MTFFIITVIPTMEFFASDKYIYAGESVEFSCIVTMTQPVYPTIQAASGSSLDSASHEKEEYAVSKHQLELGVWLYKQKELKRDYSCEVESYCGGKFMEKLQKNVTIYSYGN
jgi:hypothetical protein